MIRFTVYEVPYGKGRARHAGRRTYTPAKTVAYENRVRAVCQDEMRRRSLTMETGALRMAIIFRMPIPPSASKKRRAAMLLGEIRPTTKPDCSNLCKAIEDALNRVAYPDDSYIVELVVTKLYAETPGSDVSVERIANAHSGSNVEPP